MLVMRRKQTAAGAPPEEREDDDAEGEAAAATSASYDYLLSMPIHSLTHEKARRPVSLFGKSHRGLAPILPSGAHILIPPEAHQ